jgi:3-oxoacyl-[acyl-carrier protein] reductase
MDKHGRAVVTGAGKGIGRAIATSLLAAGHRVALFTRTEADLASFAAAVAVDRERLLLAAGDVADEDAVARFVARVESAWGGIDLLVNNAGLGIMAPVHELKIEHWDRMMSANLRGTFLFTRAVVPIMMRQHDGIIINIASIAGKAGFASGAGYAASKHAVMGFSDSLWRELRPHNIRVTAICPGSVDTHFFAAGPGAPGQESMMRPEDVAEAVLYVARQPERLFVKEIELRVTHPRNT